MKKIIYNRLKLTAFFYVLENTCRHAVGMACTAIYDVFVVSKLVDLCGRRETAEKYF